jgi:hypothetical protein
MIGKTATTRARVALIAAIAAVSALLGPAVAQEDDIQSHLLGGLTMDALSATRDRPLFTPVRHPPIPPPPKPPPAPKPPKVVKAPPPPKPPTPPKLRLVGVVMSDDTKLALLLDEKREMQRVGPGDEINGWSVVKVMPSEVELALEDQTTTFRLFDPETVMERPDPQELKALRQRQRRR